MSPLWWILVVLRLFGMVTAAERAFSFVSYYEKLVPTDIKVINQLPSNVVSEMIRNMPRTKRDASFKRFHNMYSPVMTKALSFHAFGREFLLHLHKDTKIIDDDLVLIEVDQTTSRTVNRPQGLDFYIGYVHGEPKTALSHVYWEDDNIVATINTRNETYVIEPAKRYNHRMKDLMVAYRLSDMEEEVVDSIDFCQMVYAPQLRKVNKTKRRVSSNDGFKPFKRSAPPAPGDTKVEKACTMVVVADVTYHLNVGEATFFRTVKSLIGLFSRINAIYISTNFNNKTKYSVIIRKIIVHKNESGESYNKLHKTWSAYSLLYEFSKRYFSGYCLAHLVTFAQLLDALGLAYVARTGERGGVCSGCMTEKRSGIQCLNTGVSSILFMGNMLPSPQGDLVVAHGHGFGSPHDSDICVPSKLEGGRYLMFPRTNTGKDVNNKMFSRCSIESIKHTLETNDGCFITVAANYCGNGIVEGKEQCDGQYRYGAPSPCCTSSCKLITEAVCSPSNSLCCTYGCLPSKNGTLCKDGNAMKCIEPSYCDGISTDCKDNEFEADGVECENKGKCLNGTCMSPCSEVGLVECLCSKDADACFLCCQTKKGVCKKHKNIHLSNGSICASGTCSVGVCTVAFEIQMKTIRAWRAISYEYFDSMRKFISDNIILVIIGSTLLPYLIVCFYICRKDYDAMLEEKELRQWYSTRSTAMFWKKSKVKVRVVTDVKARGYLS